MAAKSPRRIAWLLLALAAIGTLLFRTRTTGFLPGHHGYLSSQALAMAKGLGPEHSFLMILKKRVDENGVERLVPHNRFPIVSFALIRAAIAPAGGSLGGEIDAARLLMLVFGLGALVLAFRIVESLSGEPLLAAAAALIAFSSFYLQYYNDMIFNDVPALFGFFLLLFVIVGAERGGSVRWVYAASVIAVALGWQAYGVLACWWSLASLRELRMAGFRPVPAARAILAQTPTRIVLVAIAWGAMLLSFNLVNEKRALRADLADLPSVASIRFRLGLAGGAEEFPQYPELAWGTFLQSQGRRIFKAMTPSRPLHAGLDRWSTGSGARTGIRFLGLAALASACTGWILARLIRGARAEALAILVVLLSGLFWTIPMRHFSAFHDFQGMFYAGFVLVFFWALLALLPRRSDPVIAVAALGVFLFSAYDFGREKTRQGEPDEVLTADFQAIRSVLGDNRRVQVGADPMESEAAFGRLDYYLTGHAISHPAHAEFVLTRNRDWGSDPLTPRNREVFLFAAVPPISGVELIFNFGSPYLLGTTTPPTPLPVAVIVGFQRTGALSSNG